MKRGLVLGVAAATLLCAVLFGYRAYLIGQLQDAVRAKLTDPSSAQFRKVQLFSDWTPSGSAMCGEVNVKNRMGGYVGFLPFTVVGDLASIDDEFMAEFKKSRGHPACPFVDVAPWWHLK